MRPVYEFPEGEQAAKEELIRVIQAELHRIGLAHMRRERRDHTLQVTNLVNEAYLRFVCLPDNEWSNRNDFLAALSRVMREILVDYARSRKAQIPHGQHEPDVVDLDIALREFAEIAPRQARLVELRFFGGLSLEEAAAFLKVSPRTAANDWRFARGWLRQRLGSA